ncbi:hypothetical protein [Pedobacter sp. UBA4863]|uniref:hypothetical protein n=1 Tax=Pedobacter sp. UBA4863 TaxID=1947060 RepID=UPI0025E78D57|nr:hypothetical protein [Pedobacter sp. UBA4863]
MKNIAIIFILLLATTKLYAQPGGGGLRITNLYNQIGEKINIYSDSSIKIRSFSLQ